MLRVLLVDDEILVRAGIKMLINWRGNGFEIVGESSNGVQALQLCEELKPDIILTDIRMPQMDGIELIKNLKKKNSKLKVLILSCYDDYSYMKEALNFGVSDYILKPEMSGDSLLEALLHIKEEIIREEEKDREYYELKRKAEMNFHLSRETFFKEIIYGAEQSTFDIQRTADKLDIKFMEDWFAVAVIYIDNYCTIKDQVDTNKMYTIKTSLLNIIQGVVSSSLSGVAVPDNKQRSFILLLNGSWENINIHYLRNISENIIRAVSTYTDFSVTVGLSLVEEGIARIKGLYGQAFSIVRNRFFSRQGRVFSYQEYNDDLYDHELSRIILRKLSSSLLLNTKYMNFDMLCKALDEIFEMVEDSGKLFILNAVCVELAGWMNNQITNLQLSHGISNTIDIIHVDELFELDNIKQIKQFLREKAEKILQCAASDTNCSPIIRKAIHYMQKNYHTNICLSDVASYVNLSRSYLSAVFSEETGRNLIDYLTDYRIEMAKKMLLDEDLKMYELASLTGFGSERYFSQIFKNRTGLTPTEYKRVNSAF